VREISIQSPDVLHRSCTRRLVAGSIIDCTGKEVKATMMHQYFKGSRTLASFITMFLLLPGVSVACSSNTAPPVVDSPAADLDLKVTISDTYTPAATVLCAVQFFQDGHLVQLGGNARTSCEGSFLTLSPGIYTYMAQVPRRPSGATYTIGYWHSSGLHATEIPSRDQPVILAPSPHSVVTRSAGFSISYTPAASAGVRGHASDASQSGGGTPDLQADSGTYTGIDTRSLNAGPGSVSITREYDGQPANPGGFKSVTYTYYISSAEVNVVWQ
jgi:hypothetical protein